MEERIRGSKTLKHPKTKIRDLQLRWDMDDPREKSPVLDS
jgi:hypothetical protein